MILCNVADDVNHGVLIFLIRNVVGLKTLFKKLACGGAVFVINREFVNNIALKVAYFEINCFGFFVACRKAEYHCKHKKYGNNLFHFLFS